MQGYKVTGDAIREALEKAAGNQTRAARLLGLNRRTVTRWLERNPEFRHKLALIVDENLDLAENWVAKWIREGDQRAVFFYLRTKGGYAVARDHGNEHVEPAWQSPDLDLPDAVSPDDWKPPDPDTLLH